MIKLRHVLKLKEHLILTCKYTWPFFYHMYVDCACYRWKKRHVAFQIAYVGWDYSGFARQKITEKTIEAS